MISSGSFLMISEKSFAGMIDSPSSLIAASIVVVMQISRSYPKSWILFLSAFRSMPSRAGFVDFVDTALCTFVTASVSL